jgi:membrane carboxypeptidase/penicillin-binding protein PbpC
LLTPFVYLTAFTRGQSPGSLVWDIPLEDLPQAEVPLLDGAYQGPLRLRNALANDDLSPAVQTLLNTGITAVWRTFQQMGLFSLSSEEVTRSPEILWQDGQTSLIEILQAYGTLANEGVLVGLPTRENGAASTSPLQPVVILKVEDHQGQILVSNQLPIHRPVITSQLAYQVNHVLSDGSARWRTLGQANPLEIDRPAAAKLGQTLSGQDGWAIGYTPHLVAGVWLGNPEAQSSQVLPLEAAAIWHAIFQYAARELPPSTWNMPAGISSLEVCDPSGLLPTRICPNIVTEIFASGSEPTHPDNLYQALEINRATGLLATVNTPPELVESRVYLIVPPEAENWAELAGLPTPPEDYDVLQPGLAESTRLSISQPAPFAYVNGRVTIRGSVSGESLDYFRLQVGQGLNPRSWIQVGQDQTRAIQNGVLGEWDTRGMDGLYVIRLLRVNEAQQVDIATRQVTVDNQPPTGQILIPQSGQQFDLPLNSPLIFEVKAEDNLGLEEVEFTLDGERLASRLAPPYTLAWEAQPGNHILLVHIRDLAGNVTTLEQSFTVKR